MATQALANLDAQIWATVLRSNFVITKVDWPLNPGTGVEMPFSFPGPQNAFPTAQAQSNIAAEPAENIVPVGWLPKSGCAAPDRWIYNVYVLGTGFSGVSDNGLAPDACAYLFKNLYSDEIVNPKGLFMRHEVFTNLKIRSTSSHGGGVEADTAPTTRAYLRAVAKGETLATLVAREGRPAIEARIKEEAANNALFANKLETMPRQTLQSFLGVLIPDTVTLNIIVERQGTFGLVIPMTELPLKPEKT